MANPLHRILHGDPRKRTRFHDYAGNLPPASSLLSLPACLLSTARRKLTHRLPQRPWLSYRAVRRIARLLGPDARVLEFGAGSSTRWFAESCRRLLSVESDAAWHARVLAETGDLPAAEVVLRLPPYESLVAELDERFDFVLVDGIARDQAMRAALALVAPGGHVYLDNADVGLDDHREARRLLLAAAEPGSVRRFIDFAPGQVSVTQGLLARIATPARGSDVGGRS